MALRMKLLITPLLFSCIVFFSCTSLTKIDLLVYNAKIYTVDSAFTIAEAMAVDKGKIVATGTTKDLTANYAASEKIDAGGKFIYPGFIDAHAHFYRYGLGLETADLTGTGSWDEVLQRLSEFSGGKNTENNSWLLGRGWDQNDWPGKQFPAKEKLDSLFPDQPVFLVRIDGHAAIANQKALDLAGLTAGREITGGDIETKNGKPTGLLIDNAVDLVSSRIPPPTSQQVANALQTAQARCFEFGLTTVDDCGVDFNEAMFMDSLQKKGLLKMRVFAMLSDAPKNYDFLFSRGRIKTDHMNIRSFKVYADGALGSRGACLLSHYQDRPGWSGFLLSSQAHFDSVAAIISQNDMQMCTHAIGDSGNRTILNIYGKYLKGKNDQRWRIEHAQVVSQTDLSLFGQYNIIPSVQPTHATSDMYWAGERLGTEREKGAYAYKQLMQQNGWIPLGTDFPVEDISPFKTFCAAVFRVDAKGFPAGGYQPQNALSPQEALRGMTIWAARSNFEEHEKGSLEKGKFADFVILEKDLLNSNAQEVLSAKVWATYSGGEKVFSRQ